MRHKLLLSTVVALSVATLPQAFANTTEIDNQITTLKTELTQKETQKGDLVEREKFLAMSEINTESDVIQLRNALSMPVTTAKDEAKWRADKIAFITKQNELDNLSAVSKRVTTELETVTNDISNINGQIETLVKTKDAEVKKAQEAEQKAKERAERNKATDLSKYPIRDTNLRPHVARAKEHFAEKFGLSNIGGWRPDSDGVGTGHAEGLALDLMVPVGSQLGDDIADYLVANYDHLGISYIIWEQKFYSSTNSIYGAGGTWGWMEDRGSVTQNHYDHIHISFRP